MSTISLSTAVAALQPGISTPPQEALEAWGVLNHFCQNLHPYFESHNRFIDVICGLVFISVIAKLLRAHFPTPSSEERQYTRWDYLKGMAAVIFLAALAYKTATLRHEFHERQDYVVNSITKAVNNLQPWKTTPTPDLLKSWSIVKSAMSILPYGIVNLKRDYGYLALGIITTLGATYYASFSQHSAPNNQRPASAYTWDSLIILPLLAASVISITGFLFMITSSPKAP